MIAQSTALHRQKTAQNGSSENCLLANDEKYTTVKVVGGVIIPTLFADYLFRTPSLSGQAFVYDVCLPVSFGAPSEAAVRRRFADMCRDCVFVLHGTGPTGQFNALATRPREGGAKCEQNTFGWRCRSARALRPAAIRWANRHCTAPVRVPSERRFCKEASLAAQPSVPQAMSFTASKNRVPATRQARTRSDRYVHTRRQFSTIDSIAPLPRMNRGAQTVAPWAASGTFRDTRNRGGEYRPRPGYHTPDQTSLLQGLQRRFADCAGHTPANSTQPKDSPCSTRS